MARVNTLGLEKEIRSLNLLGVKVKPKVEEMLEAGADLIIRDTRTAADSHGLRDTGRMIKSIGHGNVVSNTSEASIEVWPKGRNKRGERNAVVGFVQHYGRRYEKKAKNGGRVTVRPGTGFFDDGLADARADVAALWEGMIDELVKQRG